MELSITFIYRIVQTAALAFLAVWILIGGSKIIGGICRSLGLFCAIAAPVLLYLESLDSIGLLLRIYLALSIIVFLVFGLDKLLAVSGRGNFRVPENVLLILSLAGVLGALSGMVVFHHKNKKAKLQFAVPVIAIAEFAAVYFLRFRNTEFSAIDPGSLTIFQWMTVITTIILCVMLVRTYIVMRLLIEIPLSLTASMFIVRLVFQMGTVTLTEVIQERPLPFFIIAAVIFLIFELIAVRSRHITSGNEVRKKTDHSSRETEHHSQQ